MKSTSCTFLRSLLCGAFCLLVSTSCYRNEIRTVEIPVGYLGGQSCFDAIRKSLVADLVPRQSAGRDSRLRTIDADYTQHRVVVTFDARQMAVKNIERAIAKAGFTTYTLEGAVSIPAIGSPPAGCAKE